MIEKCSNSIAIAGAWHHHQYMHVNDAVLCAILIYVTFKIQFAVDQAEKACSLIDCRATEEAVYADHTAEFLFLYGNAWTWYEILVIYIWCQGGAPTCLETQYWLKYIGVGTVWVGDTLGRYVYYVR